MRMEICTERLARLIVDYSIDVREGELVEISGSSVAEPLILVLYERIVEKGAHTHSRIWIPGMDEIFYKLAGDDQLDYVSAIDWSNVEEIDARVMINSSSNTRSLSGIPPERIARRQVSHRPLFERLMERISSEEMRWCGTIFPTHAFAQDADMSLTDYSDFLFSACGVKDDNYIEFWRKISAEQQEMVEYLKGRKHVRIRGTGTDLSFSIEGRSFINCDGHENMPDGEIFTSPVEDSVEGEIRFSYPVCEGGREIEDIRLRFESGRVVEASAAKNEEYLLEMLDTDDGARRVGEFGIGNNPGIDRFTKAILFDEKIRGTIHLALGLSLPETGGVNKSAIHWDMICDLRQGGEVLIDGEPFLRSGEFCWTV